MHVKALIKKGFDECTNIIFPKLCIHCGEKSVNNFFCSSCLTDISLLGESDIKIFSDTSISTVVAFEEYEVIKSFLFELKKMRLPALAKVAASYMVCQYFNCREELPEIIVPLSESFEGVKYIDIITKEVSKIINIPIKKMFFKTNIAMLQNIFFIKQTALQDKKLLLIVDKMNDAKVKKAIDSLKEMKFTEIEILAFCQ